MTSSGTHPPSDVVIVGGSAAGLSAALALGRSRRSVVVIDAGRPRNATSAHMHGVLGQDGLAPDEFLARGRRDLQPYDVAFVDGEVTDATRGDDGTFEVTLDDGRTFAARALLAATGVRDELPDIPGVRERWGIDVLHCPYCHGWEVRDQRIAVLGTTPMSAHSALMFRQLSADVTLVLHDETRPGEEEMAKLAARGVAVVDGTATGLVVEEDRVQGLRLSTGEMLAAQVLVVAPRADASSAVLDAFNLHPVPHPMGPQLGTTYAVEMGGRTSVPGLWAVGNVVDLVATVAKSMADGYSTGSMINADLIGQDASAAVADRGSADTARHADHAAHHDHGDQMPVMDEAFWESHYGSADAIWSGRPNPHLVSEVGADGGLTPGRALDVGAGEGADAIWLAQHGWQVDAVDISAVALGRGRSHADSFGPDVTERITWTQADLLTDAPEPSAYDLVAMHFMQLPPADRERVFPACIKAVAPHGALLVVAHDPQYMETRGAGPGLREMFYTAEQVAEYLGDAWTIAVQETRPRTSTDPDGKAVTHHDAVLLARRTTGDAGM